MAAYPGDPRARPDGERVFVSATGAIKRRRDVLVGRAAVCWLQGNSHNAETFHVDDALRTKLGLGFGDFQVVKHYPEQFLVIFSEERFRQSATRQQRIEDRGRVFNFAPWNEGREAEEAQLEFRVNLRIEGIPPHAWGEDVAALILGRSCAIHYVEEHTRWRERTRRYDLWAWCANPCKIPKKVWLTISNTNAEQPPVDVQVHHDPPTGLKHALIYKVFPHLAVVEDLSFINGDSGQGGPPNRKRHRELLWRYGEPDSQGEGRGHREGGHGRNEQRYRRRDDDDEGRGGYHRRHRSTSAWGHIGAANCYSTNFRDNTSRDGASHRSRNVQGNKKMTYKIKVAPVPSATRKNTKHVSFAEPLVSVFGESNDVACGNSLDDLFVLCPQSPPVYVDPMLYESLIYVKHGGLGKEAAFSINKDLQKDQKESDDLIPGKDVAAGPDPQSSFCADSISVGGPW
jgi:hypothetical protein